MGGYIMRKSIGATALASMLVLSLSLGAHAEVKFTVGHNHGGGWREHQWRGDRHHHHRGGNAGGLIAAGVAGLMLGAALSNANRYDPPPAPVPYRDVDTYVEPYGGHDWARYCSQKFATYDPATGTYLAADGRRYPCH
jgi:hypothetical protein